jgi:hypothetical protein
MQNKAPNPPPRPAQVYVAADICDFLQCGINQLDGYMNDGIIPAPIIDKKHHKRRWLRSAVDKKLGIKPEAFEIAELVQNIIRAELERVN